MQCYNPFSMRRVESIDNPEFRAVRKIRAAASAIMAETAPETPFLALNILTDPVIIFNRNRKPIFANTACAALSKPQKESIDKVVWEPYSSEIRASRLDMTLLAGYSSSAEIQTKDRKWLRIELHPDIAGESHNLAVVEIHDISNQKAKEEMIGNYLVAAVHDLKNPLTAMIGMDQFVLKEIGKRRIKGPRQWLSSALAAGERMKGILDHIIKISPDIISSGMRKEKISASELIQLTLDKKTIDIAAGGINVSVKASAVFADVDINSFSSILDLIVGNAIEHLEDRPLKRIDIEADIKGEYMCIDVSDTGSGIPSSIQNKIFIRGFSRKPGGKTGTGQGLPTARSLAQMHGGNVNLLWTKEGKGSCFRIQVPASEPPAETKN